MPAGSRVLWAGKRTERGRLSMTIRWKSAAGLRGATVVLLLGMLWLLPAVTAAQVHHYSPVTDARSFGSKRS